MLQRLEELYRSVPRRARQVVGAACMLGGLLFYFRADADRLLKVGDHYDLTYYYLNSKYFEELGYLKLYEAMLVADDEGPKRWRRIREYRDLETYEHRDRRDALKRRDEIKAGFSEERWGQFSDDVRFLQKARIGSSWSYFFLDHGYNPPPMWTVSGKLLSEAVPLSHAKWITSIDLVLLLLMFLAIWRAFGSLALFLSVMFFTLTFGGTWPVAGQALLRFDWLTCTVMAMCAYQLGRPALAGGLLGYAACMRIFPAVFFLPFVAVFVHHIVVEKRLHQNLSRFALAALGAGVTLIVAALAWLGPSAFVEGATKIMLHASPESYSSSRVGFADFLVFHGETSRAAMGLYGGTLGKAEEIWALQPYVRWVGFLAVVLLWAYTIWRSRERPHLVMPLCVLPLFLLTTPQINYFNIRVLLFVWAAYDFHRLRRWVGPAFLLGIEAAAFAIDAQGLRYTTTSTTSTLLAVYWLFVVGTLLHELLFDAETRPEKLARLSLRARVGAVGLLAALVVVPYVPYLVKHHRGSQPEEVTGEEVLDEQPEGTWWTAEGTTRMERGGLRISFSDPLNAERLSVTLDSNDTYLVRAWAGGEEILDEEVSTPRRERVRGLQEYVFPLPAAGADPGLDEVLIRPLGGDGRFALGHVRPASVAGDPR